ncbi:phosphoglycerate dehydrogenase, partial [Candidatus Peribacteria bacterium]|nr:phosphoglycerate dehydrogenase [Candidatus Peribacteria bacterium]
CFIYSRFTAEVLRRLPKLKLLCTRSVGYNHIDLDACAKQGITVCHVPDYGSHVIAEHVFALLLGTLRHIGEADARTKRGQFDYHGLRGISLRGKTIGIIGTGKIGRRVAEIAQGFGMQVIAVDRCRALTLERSGVVRYVSLSALLKDSDIISLHIPSTPETHHCIDAQALASMKPGVILVNTARGDLIDAKALLKSLEDRHVRYALLDVLEHERNFAENAAIIGHPNVVTTPHIAFYAEESMRNMYDDALRSIAEWQAGKTPEHVVRPIEKVCDLPGLQRS